MTKGPTMRRPLLLGVVCAAVGFLAGSIAMVNAADVSTIVVHYQWRTGDTLTAVAAVYSTSAACIRADNGHGSTWTPPANDVIHVVRGECPPATTTTAATTTTTVAPTTTQPSTTTSGPPTAGCVTGAVFCDTFDTPQAGNTQTGDLSAVDWGVSRDGSINLGQDQLTNGVVASHNACAPTVAAYPPADVKICSGRLAESENDGHHISSLNMYPKQPFDFAGRTGTVAFDVSLNSDGTHGAWPEFAITQSPVPGTHFSIGDPPGPVDLNEVGVTFDGCGGFQGVTCVGRVYFGRAGQYTIAQGSQDLIMGDEGSTFQDPTAVLVRDGSVAQASKTSTPDMALNHVEVRVAQNAIQVWASDPGGANFHQIAHVVNPQLSFTRGLVWMDDVHYNARKAIEPCECGTQFDHSFVWDNLSFDGPATFRDRGFDVPYANLSGCFSAFFDDAAVCEGFKVANGATKTLTVQGVASDQTPTAVKVVLNTETYDTGAQLGLSVNGGPEQFWAEDSTFHVRSIFFQLPATAAVDGSNTLTFRGVGGGFLLANVSVILVAAAPVP